MSLLRAERRRFVKRRMTKWVFGITAALLLVIIGAYFLQNQKPTPEIVAQAKVRAEQAYQEESARFETYRAECEKNAPEGKCEGPQREWYQPEQFMPSQYDFKKMFETLLFVWACLLAMAGFLLGASFVGAEWNSGSMMNLLTWRPRRMQVLGTKLGAALGWMAAAGVVSLAVWVGLEWVTGTLRGNTDHMTPGVWQSFGLSSLRGLGMILLFTAFGFVLASIGRHTALALGVAIGVVVVGQVGLQIVLQMARVPFSEAYLLPIHAYAWMNKSVVLQDWSSAPTCDPIKGCGEPPSLELTWQSTGSYALAGLVVVAAIAFWQIRRRDIS